MMMISREEILAFMREVAYRPLNAEELVETLNIDDVVSFLKLLADMEAKGEVILTRKNKYGLPEKMNLLVGRLQGHGKGFSFLIPDNPNEQDVFISLEDSNGAMHNDRIIVRLHPPKNVPGRREGEVIRILDRANQQIVGTFEQSGNFGFVVSDDTRIYQDIFISKSNFNGAVNGDKVVIEITRWPEPRRNPEGRVIVVLGKAGDPGVDILSIIKKYKLPEDFPEMVMEEVSHIPYKISDEELQDRRDLRQVKMVTIDGEDAKDLDDAVSVSFLPNGNFQLGVHIADVANYVQPGTPLDDEAYKRATSIYLVDRVIPMLPHKLSNGICSLNANEDRLAMSCVMEINPKGEVENYEVFPAVINVDRRMTYTNVRKILVDSDQELIREYQDFVDDFKLMEKLALILRQRRLNRGAIDFDFPESKVKLDEQGKADEIVKRERTIAEKIIEEFMLVANETVAEHIYWLEFPGVFRVHEEPKPEKLTNLNNFLHNFGYHIKGINNEVHPAAFQEIVNKVEGRPEEKIINTVMLRSMMHARYSSVCQGHFGLAAKYYTHFTSPIRRYPDLIVHRVLKETWRARKNKNGKTAPWLNKMADYAEQSSLREKLAEEAERESVDMKKVEYMERHLGETFEGIVSSVMPFGMFIELDNTIEGLVHVSSMADDYYTYIEEQLAFVGRHTNKTYKLGDKVRIQVVKANTVARQIDFELVVDSKKEKNKKQKVEPENAYI
ncbi:MAG: ribonuclease R [Bacillota bacterium]|nr:ribonuclease R [Bacillota bacterium]